MCVGLVSFIISQSLLAATEELLCFFLFFFFLCISFVGSCKCRGVTNRSSAEGADLGGSPSPKSNGSTRGRLARGISMSSTVSCDRLCLCLCCLVCGSSGGGGEGLGTGRRSGATLGDSSTGGRLSVWCFLCFFLCFL